MASQHTFNRFLAPLALTLVILFSGCVGQTPAEVESNFGSTEGVVMKFFEGTPPSLLGEGETFDVGVTLENLGAHEVSSGDATVYLRGVNPANFGYGSDTYGTGVTQVSAADTCPGADATNQYECTDTDELTCTDFYDDAGTAMERSVTCDATAINSGELVAAQVIEEQVIGGQDVATWAGLCYGVDLNTDRTVSFISQSCYKYQTKATFDSCFNENPYAQTTGAETCSVVGNKPVTNSDAPVKVTSVAESPAGTQKFRFIVKVSNEGDGQLYNSKSGTACISTQLKDLNVVHIESMRIGTLEVVNSAGVIDASITSKTWLDDAYSVGVTKPSVKLINGEGQFMFTYQPVFTASVFTDPVEITLSYGYSDQSSKSMQISSIPGVSPSC